MRRLSSSRSHRQGLVDLLPWATLSDSGLVATKSGQYVAGYYFRPPDSASSTDAQSEAISARMNTALTAFGTGWASWTDVVSIPSFTYPAPEASHFPDAFSRMVDDERRKQFQAEGSHYENDRVFLFSYTPPIRQVSSLESLLYKDESEDRKTPMQRIQDGFEKTLRVFEDNVGSIIGLRRMQSFPIVDATGRRHLQDELVNYLNYVATGKTHGVIIPAAGAYLDCLIGGQEAWTGETPIIGGDYVGVICIDGFPAESSPNIIAALNTLSMPYRFTQRMIYLDTPTAVRELEKFRKKWGQKVRGLLSVIMQTKDGPINEHALTMKREVDQAISMAESGDVRFGWYSPTVIVRHHDRFELAEMQRSVVQAINDCGFGARVETTNSIEAWRGGLPGDIDSNVRRPLFHTGNLSDLLPLSGVWTGESSAPCPLYPQPSPPLMHAATIGGIPFRFNFHVHDVGHTLLFGPTGNGKSTFTAVSALQARRYEGMRIWAFDYKRGMLATVNACQGRHYEIGGISGSPSFCPLSVLETEADREWAEDWLAICYELQTQKKPDPDVRDAIHKAILKMATPGNPHRSMTDFVGINLQHHEAREAFRYYTVGGAAGWLTDARADNIDDSDFNVFEVLQLMEAGEATSLPVLLYLFRRFERSLDGRPSLLFIAEAWMALSHPLWRNRIQRWLRTLRSKNCSVIMDTQSLADVVSSNLLSLLVESCPRKVFLPNADAFKKGTKEQPGPYDLYRIFGLNDNQIEIIRTAVPKRDYYVVGPEGCRLINLGLGPIALSIAGATSEQHVEEIKGMLAEHGDEWLPKYLSEKGVELVGN